MNGVEANTVPPLKTLPEDPARTFDAFLCFWPRVWFRLDVSANGKGDKDMGTSRDRCNITHVLVHARAGGREVYDWWRPRGKQEDCGTD